VCGHQYHKECIANIEKLECPVCKKSISTNGDSGIDPGLVHRIGSNNTSNSGADIEIDMSHIIETVLGDETLIQISNLMQNHLRNDDVSDRTSSIDDTRNTLNRIIGPGFISSLLNTIGSLNDNQDTPD
jgi:hypothetical protein